MTDVSDEELAELLTGAALAPLPGYISSDIMRALRELQARRAAEAHGGWRTIESAPRDGDAVLLNLNNGCPVVGFFGRSAENEQIDHTWIKNEETCWRVKWDHYPLDRESDGPIGWRPLPSPPGASGHDLPAEVYVVVSCFGTFKEASLDRAEAERIAAAHRGVAHGVRAIRLYRSKA